MLIPNRINPKYFFLFAFSVTELTNHRTAGEESEPSHVHLIFLIKGHEITMLLLDVIYPSLRTGI